jgi:hypothetical protein
MSGSEAHMPRYYFVVSSPLGTEGDDSGLELPDDGLTHQWALDAVHEIRAEDAKTDWTDWHLKVLDGSGSVLVSIPVGESPDTAKH